MDFQISVGHFGRMLCSLHPSSRMDGSYSARISQPYDRHRRRPMAREEKQKRPSSNQNHCVNCHSKLSLLKPRRSAFSRLLGLQEPLNKRLFKYKDSTCKRRWSGHTFSSMISKILEWLLHKDLSARGPKGIGRKKLDPIRKISARLSKLPKVCTSFLFNNRVKFEIHVWNFSAWLSFVIFPYEAPP